MPLLYDARCKWWLKTVHELRKPGTKPNASQCAAERRIQQGKIANAPAGTLLRPVGRRWPFTAGTGSSFGSYTGVMAPLRRAD